MRGSLGKNNFRSSDHQGELANEQAKAVPLGKKLTIILTSLSLCSV